MLKNKEVGDKVVWGRWVFPHQIAKHGSGPFTISKVRETQIYGTSLVYYCLEEIPDEEFDHLFFVAAPPSRASAETFSMVCSNHKCGKEYVVTDRSSICGVCYWDLQE